MSLKDERDDSTSSSTQINPNIRNIKYIVSVDQLQSIHQKELNLPPELCKGFWKLNTHNQQLTTSSDTLLASFFPYMIGPVFSSVRIHDYLRLLKSITFWLCITQIICYIISLSNTTSSFKNYHIDPKIIEKYSISLYYLKEKHQYWRLFTSIIIHPTLSHLFIDIILQLCFVLGKEVLWRPWRFLVSFLLSYIAGSFFSMAFSRSFITGSGIGIFGVFGSFVAMYIVEVDKFPWHHKIGTLILIIFIVSLLLLEGIQEYISNYGNLLGCVAGGCIGLILFAYTASSRQRKITFYVLGIIISVISLCIGVLPFFFNTEASRKPTITPEIS